MKSTIHVAGKASRARRSAQWLLLRFAMLCTPLVLGGCLTPFIESATEAYDHSQRDPNKAAAAAGDPQAQYRLGNSYCCEGGGPLDLVSVYDNQKATQWYCRAARRDYGPAQLRLARIYAGHPISGLRPTQHISSAVGTPDTDVAVALMWASVAASNGVEDAIALRDEIAAEANTKQRARAAMLLQSWRTAPCLWTEVFPTGRDTREQRRPVRLAPASPTRAGPASG